MLVRCGIHGWLFYHKYYKANKLDINQHENFRNMVIAGLVIRVYWGSEVPKDMLKPAKKRQKQGTMRGNRGKCSPCMDVFDLVWEEI